MATLGEETKGEWLERGSRRVSLIAPAVRPERVITQSTLEPDLSLSERNLRCQIRDHLVIATNYLHVPIRF